MPQTIAERLADILMRPVDARARKRAALHVLDWVGCAAIGATTEPGRALQSWARGEPEGPCRTIGVGRRSLATASVLNVSVGNVLEMDDFHKTAILHPGPVIVPPALAVAEREGASGTALLDALVRGYEAAIRIGNAVGPAHYKYWHITASCGGFGAAAAAASLLGLDARQLVSALGNTGTQASGLWQLRHESVMTKQLHNGRAAQSGVLSADLARHGFTGPATLLEGPLGFFAAMCPDGDPAIIVRDPDAVWKIFETSFKPWPSCRHTHPTVDAALALRKGLDPAAIDRVHVDTYDIALTFCDRVRPTTTVEAKFSLQHTAAVCLLKGEPQLGDFDPPGIADSRIAALRERVTVAAGEPYASAYPARYGARVSVALKSGKRLEAAVTDALGDPEIPLSEAAIVDKAGMLLKAAGVSPASVGKIADASLTLANGGSIAALTEAMP